jgi:ribosomal protein S18 acetylase RimI-like enzyme
LLEINKNNIQNFFEEAEIPAAQEAWQAGLCITENEALDAVKAQEKDLLEKFNDQTFFEEWKSHNFLFQIYLPEDENLCGYFWYSVEEKQAFIKLIYITKAHRGKGFATDLLKELEVDLTIKGFDCIRLHVFTKNQAAFNLYKNLGYEVETKIEVSITMIKNLNPS